MRADEIDYQILGEDLQAVVITLDPGEAVVAEAGAMMYMREGIEMATTLDPNAQGGGLFGKLLQGGKRMLSGDSFFVTVFMNQGQRRSDVAFSAPTPGRVIPIDLRQWGGTVIAQKNAFLCAARGTNVTLAFNRRFGAGFFGGEGFIMQRIEGDGLAFLHASGTLVTIDLAPGEELRVDTGCFVGMQPSVQYDIRTVPGIKTALFGGEGLFLLTLTGPGRVVLQTMPFSRLADRIIAAAPRAGGARREEGGLLGGLGNLLDGDR
ncbi:MAG TPA: TIGR00266 family protein [Gemmatirosa sp.]|nr:TIGR00266 family protein [Gemmatirosa sp.]